MPNRNRHTPPGVTLLELLVVIAIVGVMVALLWPALSSARAAAQAYRCRAQLQHIAIAFHGFALDHDDRLPAGMNAAVWTFSLEPYLDGPAVYACPADASVLPDDTPGLTSYAWRDAFQAGVPAASLEGADPAEATAPRLILVFDQLPTWHADATIQASDLDTSTASWPYDEAMANLATPIR